MSLLKIKKSKTDPKEILQMIVNDLEGYKEGYEAIVSSYDNRKKINITLFELLILRLKNQLADLQ